MRVRLKFTAHDGWTVESKRHWYSGWEWEQSFYGDDAYERAKVFALLLKQEQIEEIL